MSDLQNTKNENSKQVAYALLKDQCVGKFVAESNGTPDYWNVCPTAQTILSAVDMKLHSQNVAFKNVVLSSLSTNSDDIFKFQTSTQYEKFIVLLTMMKLLTDEVNGQYGERAKEFIGRIDAVLVDDTFRESLFQDPTYCEITNSKLSNSDVQENSQTENLPKTTNTSYGWMYGGALTLAIGALTTSAIVLLRSKK